MRTVRWNITGLNVLKDSCPQARLLCSWHGELALNTYMLKKSKIFCWLVVSQHHDGQIIANILEKWKFSLLRGSTNAKGAINTTKSMLSLLKKPNTIIGITADGPKGPRHQSKPGAIRIAQQCGATIILMRAHVSHCWQLNSWDRFVIPKPFSQIHITLQVASLPIDSKSKTIPAMVDKEMAAAEHAATTA